MVNASVAPVSIQVRRYGPLDQELGLNTNHRLNSIHTERGSTSAGLISTIVAILENLKCYRSLLDVCSVEVSILVLSLMWFLTVSTTGIQTCPVQRSARGHCR